jgi:hypothetical protein
MGENSVTGIGVGVTLLLGIALYVWTALALGAVFRKLGESGWKAWVPIYNTVVFFQLGQVSPFWVIALFVPGLNIVGLVFAVIATHTISTRFGKGAGYTILGVLLQPVWSSILGWGGARDIEGEPPALAFLHPDGMHPVGTAPAGETAGASLPQLIEQVPARVPLAEPSPAVPDASSVPNSAPGAVAEPVEAAAEPAPIAPGFSFTPLLPVVVAEPPAPIEMPDELSVRVPARAEQPAAPLIDAVPDFSANPAPSTGAETVLPASVLPAAPQPAEHDAPSEDTIIVGRRNLAWLFETASGQRVPLTGRAVVLGRNPLAPAELPDAQLVTVRDAGRTISKTHASVELGDAGWMITDLNSTNGVYLIGPDGNEIELEPGDTVPVSAHFVLGEVSARIFQEE